MRYSALAQSVVFAAAAAATTAARPPAFADRRSQQSRVHSGDMSASVSSHLVALDGNPFVHGVQCDLVAGFVAVLALADTTVPDACDQSSAPDHCAFMRNPVAWEAPDVLHGFREFPCKRFPDDETSAAPYFAAVAARVSSRVVFAREDGTPLLQEHVFAVTEVAALHVLQSVKGEYSATRTVGDPPQPQPQAQSQAETQAEAQSHDSPPEWVPDTTDVPALRKSFAVSPAAAAAIEALRGVAEADLPQPETPFHWPIEEQLASSASGDSSVLVAEAASAVAARRLAPSPSPRRGTYGGVDDNGAYYQTPKGKFSAKVSLR